MCRDKPDDHRSINNLASIYMNSFQKYNEAIIEFNRAINLNPQASYILNRSICYYKMGNMQKAKEDALMASQKGAVITDSYKTLLQLK
jgi:lipoprotein NlpI